MNAGPVRIEPTFVERVWGATSLGPWYPDAAQPTGEVWFPAGDLLVKFIFTADRLSVQVHPDDEYGRRHENSRGKTEMWYLLRAAPGARIAAGFRERCTRDKARAAASSGEIEHLLHWWPAEAGQVFFIPAGTVHAIGGGLALCEIQQNSDVTYRLYDYGRPRPLHLDKALDVARLEPHPGPSRPSPGKPIACAYFTATVHEQAGVGELECENGELLIVLEGNGRFAEAAFRAGEVWSARSSSALAIEPAGAIRLLRVRRPAG